MEVALAVATELAVNETSPAKERADADWDARGGQVVNAEMPESRWLKHSDHRRFFRSETTAHYEDHLADLAAILPGPADEPARPARRCCWAARRCRDHAHTSRPDDARRR